MNTTTDEDQEAAEDECFETYYKMAQVPAVTWVCPKCGLRFLEKRNELVNGCVQGASFECRCRECGARMRVKRQLRVQPNSGPNRAARRLVAAKARGRGT